MPLIQVEMFEGRTMDQKREMVKEVTDALCRTVGCDPEAVTIIIREMSRDNLAKAGKVFSDTQ